MIIRIKKISIYITFMFLGLALVSDLNGQTPNTLVLYESDGQGVIIPQMTTLERENITPNANEKGLLVYDTDRNAIMNWDGSKWYQSTSPWNHRNDFRVIRFTGSHNSYGVEIVNSPVDSTFASGLYSRGNFYGVRGETFGTGGLTSGISGKGGAIGVHAVNTNCTTALYAVSTGTAKAGIFDGDVEINGTVTSDTLVSSDILLQIKPTTINYTCDASMEGMIQYYKSDRRLRVCIEINSTPTYSWVDLH